MCTWICAQAQIINARPQSKSKIQNNHFSLTYGRSESEVKKASKLTSASCAVSPCVTMRRHDSRNMELVRSVVSTSLWYTRICSEVLVSSFRLISLCVYSVFQCVYVGVIGLIVRMRMYTYVPTSIAQAFLLHGICGSFTAIIIIHVYIYIYIYMQRSKQKHTWWHCKRETARMPESQNESTNGRDVTT